MPTVEDTVGRSYWVLDDATPALPALLQLIGVEHGVKVPRLRVPAGLLRRLPATLTRADPETLSFLSTDRYPTGPAETIAREHGLTHADVGESLRRWSRYLKSHQGTAPHSGRRTVARHGP